MAEGCDDLEALRPFREDLFDLALKLRVQGLDSSPAQLVDAHNLLLGMRLTGQLPAERDDWRAYLAPIFCRSESDQQTFYRVFPAWVEEAQAKARRSMAIRKDLALLEACLRQSGADFSAQQMDAALEHLLDLRADTESPRARSLLFTPLESIFCSSPQDHESFSRAFERWVDQARLFPEMPRPDPAPAPAVRSMPAWRRLGFLVGLIAVIAAVIWGWNARTRSPVETPTEVPVQHTVSPTARPTASERPRPAPFEAFPARPLEIVPPRTSFGWSGADLRHAAAAAPALVFLLWLIWRFIDRRLVLTREPGTSPDKPHTRWVRGAEAKLFEPADLRYAAGRFRDPVSRPTRRIDARRTVAATVRKAGFYSPVYRSRRRHPEYLVLLDRASVPVRGVSAAAPVAARDHLAAYGEALMEEFRAEQVITHVYHFDRDPRRCRPAGSNAVARDLAALEAQHGDCRLIILSAADGLFESLSGRPVAWLSNFEPWPQRIVLTPKPVCEWSFAEATLALRGFAVAPAHPKSLPLLAQLWLPLALRGDVPAQALQQVRLLAPMEAHAAELPQRIQRHGERWLESEPPDAGGMRSLLEDLRSYLGAEGFLLLQALAVYPELTWPLSLYVDWRLFDPAAPKANAVEKSRHAGMDRRHPVDRDATPQAVPSVGVPAFPAGTTTHNADLAAPAPGARVARLLSLSRLPWLRYGRMPDYLRLALVQSLPKQKHGEVVAFYQDLLKAADRQGPQAIALDIGPPPEKSFKRKLEAWFRGDDTLYGDRIFAKILLGGRPGWLDVELPQMLARWLPGTGWDDVSARVFAGLLTIALLGGGAYAAMGHYAEPIDQWLLNAEMARHARTKVTIFRSPQSSWLESPLVAALTGRGFAPEVQESPSLLGRVAEPPWPRPATNQVLAVLAGEQASREGEWVVQRLRYINYGREIEIRQGRGYFTRNENNLDDKGQFQPMSANEIIIWLADAPQTFQDSLTAPAPTPPPVREPEMLRIPAGEFKMGSPKSEKGRYDDEGPQHSVRIAKPFELGRYEVTFEEYDAFSQTTGRELPKDEGWGRGRRPVINVSWNDAQAYAAWLSEQTHKAYRLPTEAEWEYAARAGTTTARYWGDDPKQACRFANVDDASHQCKDGYENQTAPVGSFQANKFGLQDMLGNVWEWVEDCSRNDYKGAPTDGSAWVEKDCGARALRGGSWYYGPVFVRAAYRFGGDPDNGDDDWGFRLARTLN